MGIIKLTLFTLFTLVTLFANTAIANKFVTFEDFIHYSKPEQYRIIEKMQAFMVDTEYNFSKQNKPKDYSHLQSLLNQFRAYAQDEVKISESGQSCIYGGWTSLSDNGFCANPRRLSSLRKYQSYKPEAQAIAKLNSDSYDELIKSYNKGEEFIKIAPKIDADKFLSIDLDYKSKKGQPGSCNIAKGDVFCNPAVYGKLNGKALCVAGDKDHNAYNSSYLCNKAVTHLKEKAPGDYKNLMDSIITSAQAEPGKTLFIQNLYSMYDMCICGGAASKMLDKKLAKKMYNSRTCIGLMEQSNEVYAFVKENSCGPIYGNSLFGAADKDWSNFAQKAFEQVSQELSKMRESTKDKIANYSGVGTLEVTQESQEMNRREEVLLELERDQYFESRALPGDDQIKVCKSFTPPLFNISIDIAPEGDVYKKLKAKIKPMPEWISEKNIVYKWELVEPIAKSETDTPSFDFENSSALIRLIHSKDPHKIMVTATLDDANKTVLKSDIVTIPNLKIPLISITLGKIKDQTQPLESKISNNDPKLDLKKVKYTWILIEPIDKDVDVKAGDPDTSKASIVLIKSEKPHMVKVSATLPDGLVIDSETVEVPNLSIGKLEIKPLEINDKKQKLEVLASNLPTGLDPLTLAYDWKIIDPLDPDLKITPEEKSKFASIALIESEKPHQIEVSTTLPSGEVLSAKTSIPNLQKQEDEIPQLDIQKLDPISKLQALRAAVIPAPKEIKPEEISYTWEVMEPKTADDANLTTEEDTSKASITLVKSDKPHIVKVTATWKDQKEPLVGQIEIENLKDETPEDNGSKDCSISMSHSEDKLDIKITYAGEEVADSEAFSKLPLSFSLYRELGEDKVEVEATEDVSGDEMVGDVQAPIESEHEGELQTNNPFDIKIEKGSKDIILKAYLTGSDEKISCDASSDLTIKAIEAQLQDSSYTPPTPGQLPPPRQRKARFYQGRF